MPETVVSLKIHGHARIFGCTALQLTLETMKEQNKWRIYPNYDFITKIESPSEFAKQLGRDVGKHISLHNNLKCDHPAFAHYHLCYEKGK